VDTVKALIDGNYMLAMMKGTRLTNLFRDSPIAEMRECFQKCIVGKGGLYEGYFFYITYNFM